MKLDVRVGCSLCVLALIGMSSAGQAQTQLPQVVVKQAAPAKRVALPRRIAKRRSAAPATTPTATPATASTATAGAPAGAEGSFAAPSPAATAETQFAASRDQIMTKTGTNSTSIGRDQIEAMPLGDNQPIDKVVLQTPGVAQDSAASGNIHVRNEHANVQTRIDGILLPDGVSGFDQFLSTSFIGNLALVTGALPAEYGFHTAGLLDVTTRNGAFDNGGSVTLFGGSRGTVSPGFTYGGHSGTTDYFFTGSFMRNQIGLENPTPAIGAIHDQTRQGKFFGYVATQIDPSTRLTYITGTSIDKYQIPDTPGLLPSFTAFGQSNFDSSLLNENQTEQSSYNVLALQHSGDKVDVQLSYFSRYSTLHFIPDTLADLLFNGVASDVYRRSFVNGLSGDAAYRVGNSNTLRFGVTASVENTRDVNGTVLLPLDPFGNPVDAPFSLSDSSAKTGTLFGAYLQDEWKLNDQLTLNTGLRFDQMDQYVDANQLSPRLSLAYQPFAGTIFHIGYARYFTPPQQALSAPTNLAEVANTTQQPGVDLDDPVKPERSHYFDAGVTQKVLPGFDVGVDAYYKRATNLLDDGQFGQALILDTFNYARGFNRGLELKANYTNGNFSAYGNLAWARQMAEDIVSNEFLFDPDEFAYAADHFVSTDHSQTLTGSAGVSYLLDGTRLSADLIYGSGLRSGFANTSHLPPYTQVNVGISRDVQLPSLKPTTLRFDVVNLFDKIYEIRDGSGIGVFAPQYGPRREFLASLTQQF